MGRVSIEETEERVMPHTDSLKSRNDDTKSDVGIHKGDSGHVDPHF